MPKICIEEGCIKKANYNIKNNKPKFCLEHKTNIMINVSRKICEETDCNIRANYNLLGNGPMFCVRHKKTDMFNSVAKHCKYDKCNIQPAFNLPNIKNGLYCDTHKLEGMINVITISCDH